MPLLGQQQFGLGVRDHEADAVGRIHRVKRDVGRAGLDHAEHGGQQLQRFLHQDPHERARPGALLAQQARDPVGAAIELVESEPVTLEDDSRGVRGPRHLLLEQLLDGLLLRERFAMRVPGHQHLGPL